MGLFGMKGIGDWENAMTEEEILDMEKKGYDVSSLRANREATIIEEQANETDFIERRKATAVPTDLSKLTAYQGTPRNTENDFFKDVAGKAPLLGKGKWKEKFANAPLIYGAVVQANSDLWLPGSNEFYPAVFVFALDNAHIHDTEWLTATAKKISEMKEDGTVPADCKEFMDVLRDDQSEFCFPLGSSLADGANAWCVTYKFVKQTILPGNRLPEDGIVPFLLEAQPKKQIPILLSPIPGKYYQG